MGGAKYLITNASFKVTFWFRIASYLKQKKGIFFYILYFLSLVVLKHYNFKTGIQLSPGTKIGGGLTFGHFSCIVINDCSIIGRNCTIFQGVTIGSARGKGTPIIGDNCILFAGAKIIGNVKLGNNVVVGANAVVVKDIPDNCICAGIPAKIINNDSSETIKLYIEK